MQGQVITPGELPLAQVALERLGACVLAVVPRQLIIAAMVSVPLHMQ